MYNTCNILTFSDINRTMQALHKNRSNALKQNATRGPSVATSAIAAHPVPSGYTIRIQLQCSSWPQLVTLHPRTVHSTSLHKGEGCPVGLCLPPSYRRE